MGQQKKWHPEEIDLLDELIEYYPIPLIAKKINKWHKKTTVQQEEVVMLSK